jgi:hypothetical protein
MDAQDVKVQQLGQQVQQAMDAQEVKISPPVQQETGAKTQYTYEHLVALHKMQQDTACQQQVPTEQLVRELENSGFNRKK